MSNESNKRRSGEYGNLKSQRSSDGGLEFVLDEQAETPMSSEPERFGLEEPSAVSVVTATPGEATARRPSAGLIMGALLSVIVLAVLGFVIFSGEEEGSAGSADETAEVSGFRAYGGGPNDEPSQVVERPQIKPAAAARVAPVEELSDEEAAAWEEFERSEQEEVVLEEEEAPEVEIVDPADRAEATLEPGQASPVKFEERGLSEIARERGPSPQQRAMLRQLNDQIDRGELTPLKRTNLQNPNLRGPAGRMKVPADNLAGPTRFKAGKLERRATTTVTE